MKLPTSMPTLKCKNTLVVNADVMILKRKIQRYNITICWCVTYNNTCVYIDTYTFSHTCVRTHAHAQTHSFLILSKLGDN